MKGGLKRKKPNEQTQGTMNPNDPRSTVNPNQSQVIIGNEQQLIGTVYQQDQPIVENPYQNNIQTRDLQRRMRTRHMADGAVCLNVELDDLSNENYDLYDNKDINLDKPKINENIGKERTEHYIESTRHDQFFKITEDKVSAEKKLLDKEEAYYPSAEKTTTHQKSKPTKPKKPMSATEIGQRQQDRIFAKFDSDLNEVIDKTTSKVFLLFLFTQGLLAGMGLLHLILFIQIDSNSTGLFVSQYSRSVRESFNVFHTLTFASLVGNGIKFISAFQRYQLINSSRANSTMFTELRKNMIFSGILLFFFTITFGLEIYLTTQIPGLNLVKCNGPIPDFATFRTLFIVVDIIAIMLFILNIFDVTLKSENEGNHQIVVPVSRNPYYDDSLENQNIVNAN